MNKYNPISAFILLTLTVSLAFLLTACTQPDKPTVGLYVAVKRGDLDQIERHIYWKTDINQLNVDGQSPLHESARAGRMVVAKLLLKNGAEVNKTNQQDRTALDLALINGRTQLADILVHDFKAEFDATASLFDIVSAKVDDRDVIRFLVENGADINSHNKAGETPLTIAIRLQQRGLAKHLIDNNADVNLANKQAESPLDIALELNNQDLTSMLNRYGASSNQGSTANN